MIFSIIISEDFNKLAITTVSKPKIPFDFSTRTQRKLLSLGEKWNPRFNLPKCYTLQQLQSWISHITSLEWEWEMIQKNGFEYRTPSIVFTPKRFFGWSEDKVIKLKKSIECRSISLISCLWWWILYIQKASSLLELIQCWESHSTAFQQVSNSSLSGLTFIFC